VEAAVQETKAAVHEAKVPVASTAEGKKASEEIAVGHWVRIEGLVNAVEMNGRTGVVRRRHGCVTTGRWQVRVDGKDHTLAERNLRLERVEVED